MAIYRCNSCAFVGEDMLAVAGCRQPCGKCSAPVTLFATAFYVEKLVERYFAARRELEALKEAEADPNPDVPAATAAVPPQKPLSREDLHNTASLATHEQHAPLDQWMRAKQIKPQFDISRVDTTGFFDEAAQVIGNEFDTVKGALEQVRYAYRKGWSWVNLDLSKHSPESRQTIKALFRKLYSHTFFAKHIYKLPTDTLGVAIQPAQAIRSFFEGGWLEWYVFIQLLSLCAERNRAFSCARGMKIELQNELQRELDVVFLIDKHTPVVIECKSGEFRSEIDKYVKLRRQLRIDKTQFIICSTDLTDQQATGLTAMYDLTFVSLGSLHTHLSKIV